MADNMNDIVEDLLKSAWYVRGNGDDELMKRAAATIIALRAEVATAPVVTIQARPLVGGTIDRPWNDAFDIITDHKWVIDYLDKRYIMECSTPPATIRVEKVAPEDH